MRLPALSSVSRFPVLNRIVAACVLGLGVVLIAAPRPAAAADPTPTAPPADAPVATPTPDPTPTPTPTPDPTPTPAPTPTPDPTPTPAPAAKPVPVAPRAMNLFVASGFKFQDPNSAACTATAARSMLNFISLRSTGGEGFLWQPTVWGSVRDRILAWERSHDTLIGGRGSDPHGWRNALNLNGWGQATLLAGSRVYDDVSYGSFDGAMKAAVRALVLTGKPVGMLGWRGAHAQMITGYYGLKGNPFAKDAAGHYANAFSVAGFYITDPLKKTAVVNKPVKYITLKTTRNYKIRFQRYYEKDSVFDDAYTPGYRVSRDEWYGKYVLVVPIR